MYSVTVTRRFVAQHYLTVPSPGPEGKRHSHRYRVEVTLNGPSLNEYGYLIDIDAVRGVLDAVEERYRDAVLNDLPEFGDENPSVERFARIIADQLLEGIASTDIDRIAVTMWEDDDAAASYEQVV